MATQVNWSQMPRIQGGGPEIASISNLLGSIAEAREKRRQFEEELAQKKAEADQLAKHQAALEEYNRQNLQQMQEYHKQSLAQKGEAAKQKLAQTQQTEADKQMGAVRGLVDAGDLPGAQGLGKQYGVDVTRNDQAVQAAAEKARLARGDQTAGAMGLIPGFSALPPEVMQTAARDTAQNTDEELNPKLAPVQFHMPVGSVIDYDPVTSKKAAMAERGRRQADFLEKNKLGIGADELGQKAMMEVGNAMGTEGYKGDPVADAMKTKRDFEHQQNFLEAAKARRAASASPDGFDKTRELANARALAAMQTRAQRFVINSGLNKLSAAKGEAENVRSSLESGNPLGAAQALEKITALGRGGMATTPALKLSIEHLNGLVGKGQNWVAKALSGDFGDEARDNLMHAFETLNASIDEHIKARHQAFVQSEYTGANQNIKGNIEDKEAEIFGPLMPPGWTPDYDPEALQVVPTTGLPPSKTGRGTPRAGRGGGVPATIRPTNDPDSFAPTGGGPTGKQAPPASQAAGAGQRSAEDWIKYVQQQTGGAR